MDQIGIQQQKAIAHEQKRNNNNNYQTLKKVTKLLFSLSLFSFFFALPSWLPLHFNQPIDKNFMFLLCNGLLVFLAKYSGLFKSLSTSRRNYDSFRVFEFGPLSDPMMLEATTSRERETEEDDYVTQQEKKEDESATAKGMEEIRISSIVQRGDEEDQDNNYELEVDFFDNTTTNYEEEEEEEGNSGVLSDEELNKKFDEFIKRMKEEITIDARRTLVVV